MITCSVCEKQLVSIKSLSQHILNHKITSEEYYCMYIGQPKLCTSCGTKTKFLDLTRGYQNFCGLKCSNNNQERKEKFSESYSKNNMEEVKRKREETNIERFGDPSANRNEEIKERTKNSFFKNRIPKVVEQFRSYDIEVLNIEDYNNYTTPIKLKCLKCGKEFEESLFNVYQRTYKCSCQLKHSSSIGESELKEFILSIISDEIIMNSKPGKFEIDILIPSKKIAIEYNGLYWHSELILRDPVKYHVSKLEECNKLGFKLIQIFEDEWLFKKDIVKSRLKMALGCNNVTRIHARKCEIKEINSNTKNDFLDMYHIQGMDISIVRLGSFYNDELISVMTFSYGNISKGSKKVIGEYELSRFCISDKYVIPGIASKMLSYFKRKYDWSLIYSYADRRWSEGNLYYKLGFKLDRITDPNYWYTKDGFKRIHRFNLRKTKLDPKDITEFDLRDSQGYYRLWDAGNFRFSMSN